MNEIERLMAEQIAQENRLQQKRARGHGVRPRSLELCADFVELMKRHEIAPVPLFRRVQSETTKKFRFKGSRGSQYVGINTTSYTKKPIEFWPFMREPSGHGAYGVVVEDGAALPVRVKGERNFVNMELLPQKNVKGPRDATAERPAWRSYLIELDEQAKSEANRRGELFFDEEVIHRLDDESEFTRATRYLIETRELYKPEHYY